MTAITILNLYPPNKWEWWILAQRFELKYGKYNTQRFTNKDTVCSSQSIKLSLQKTGARLWVNHNN